MTARTAAVPRSPAGLGMARTESRGQLSRAGWHILSSSQLHDPTPPPADMEAEGARLVDSLAASWCGKYIYTIRRHGAHGGGYHYECIFSCPTNEMPVPSIVVRCRFALLVPRAGSSVVADPQLVFSFEEGDLRHAWKLERGPGGRLQTAKGQQFMSLRKGYFEKYLDDYITEKERARQRGVTLVTPFEASRLPRPKTPSDVASETTSQVGDDVSSVRAATKRSDTSNLAGRAMLSSGIGDEEVPELQVDTEMQQAIKSAMKTAGLASDNVPVPGSLSELLANVFDAADEEDAGELPHYDVNRLLRATLCGGFGMAPWDIQSLLTTAQENDAGMIECKPFLQSSPELILELRRRRLAFVARGLPGVEIDPEAVKFCFGAELGETADSLLQLFMQRAADNPRCAKRQAQDPAELGLMRRASVSGSKRTPGSKRKSTKNFLDMSGGSLNGDSLVGLRRRAAQECIRSLPRLSPQEAQRIMEFLPEDEEGFLQIEDLAERLEEMRTGAMLNALVESDTASLRKHLVLCFRHVGITDEGTVKLWQIRPALMRADQICLSRQQILTLSCLAVSSVDSQGNVDVATFLGTCCVVIPHMFDASGFVATAERLQIEAAELQRLRENAEIAALGAAKVDSLAVEENEVAQEVQVDQDTVEKALIQLFQYSDDVKRNPSALPPETLYSALYSKEDPMVQMVASCQLSDHELCGFVAEMTLDHRGEVAYVDHVKRTVQMIFELRRNQLLSAYLAENAFETQGIPSPDLDALEALFPLWQNGRKPEKKQEESTDTTARRQSTKRWSTAGGSGANASSKGPNSFSRQPSQEEETEHRSASKVRARLSSLMPASGMAGLANRDTPCGRGYERRKMMLGKGLRTTDGDAGT